jgi:hypothetical protein
VRSLWAVAVAFMLQSIAHPVYAASAVIDVTPGNIANQPLALRVAVRPSPAGFLTFDVFIGPGRSKVAPSREGLLELNREVVQRQRPDTSIIYVQQQSLCCRVQEVSKGDSLQYSFGISVDILPRADFLFRSLDSHGTPTLPFYKLILKEFAPSPALPNRPLHPTGTAPPP